MWELTEGDSLKGLGCPHGGGPPAARMNNEGTEDSISLKPSLGPLDGETPLLLPWSTPKVLRLSMRATQTSEQTFRNADGSGTYS
jgi:hypothetical protein